MSLYNSLQAHKHALTELYNTRLEEVGQLQKTLIEDVLPNVVFELGLNAEEEAGAKEWIQDTR